MGLFTYLFSDENRKQIKSLIEKLTPYLYQEWRELEPKVKVLLRLIRPSAEKKMTNFVAEVENASKDIDQEFSGSVNRIFTHIEDIFSFLGIFFNQVIKSNKRASDFIDGFSKSATSFENIINEEINCIKNEKSALLNELCKFENLLDKIDVNAYEYDSEVMTYTKSENFRDAIINNCTKSQFSEERVSRIEEILDLHCLGFYGGSITLLYSQIEGVITDTLIETGHAEVTHKNTLVHVVTKLPFPGLSKKMSYTGGNIEYLEEVFNKLSEVKFLDGAKARTISQLRNIILHGNFVKLPDAQHSLCLLLTLYVITLKIRLMPDTKRLERSIGRT